MSDYEHPYNALPQGYRLQEYELVRVLGDPGGFGITYLALDHHLNKDFAIKEYLPSNLATRTADGSVVPQASNMRGDFDWGLARFVKEAQILARFDHRHIVKVHRYLEAHGTAYIVMEYAEGKTLEDYLVRQGPLREAKLKKILYPLLNGLAVVHEADLLHRDIKPLNIVIRDEDGSPVLLDFGAARQAIGKRTHTVIYTPGYAPYEQHSDRFPQGAWTDIYALGAVCYRALTGDVPTIAPDRVRDDPLVPVSQRCASQASQAFLSAIDAALSVWKEGRPPSVAEWRAMLEADGEEVPEPAALAMEAPHNALPSGYRLQEYELVRVLGVGGFGMTYLGFDHHLDKAVAIKEYLPSDLATRTADGSVAPQASNMRGDFNWGLERFLDEARALARFDHRHIIRSC